VALLLVLCGFGLVLAEQGTGRIAGQVTKDGEGVGAVVVLINELRVTQVTDQDGKFTFESVPAGSYTLIFTLGDNSVVRQAIVTAGKTNELEQVVDWDVGVHEEVVVTAAARAAKIVDAPAAVTAIGGEQIEQQASHGQVPKVLEFTPGAEITQSGLYDFNFNTRGFNSSLNRRVSTYIDGRDVGVVLLGAQEWAAISGGLDDIATLEFIRGPSAALYGANASSGVVNITTKAPKDSLGSMVRLAAGSLDTRTIDFRRADKIGKGWYSKFALGIKDSGDFTVSRNPDGPNGIPGDSDDLGAPEYSEFCRNVGDPDCLPAERTLIKSQDDQITYGALRLDKYLTDSDVLTFEAGVSNIGGPVFLTGIGRVQNVDSRRPFARFNWLSEHWSVLAHYSSRKGEQVNLTQDLRSDYNLDTDTQRYGVEGQGNWLFAGEKVRFVVGGAATRESVDTASWEGEQTVVYQPIDAHREAIFTQVDWNASRKVKFVFAARADASTLHKTQYSPKAALVYRITPQNSLRFTYNRAFQVANYSEFFLHTKIASFPIGGFVRTICQSPILQQPVDCGIEGDFIPILAVGNDDLNLEHTEAWEVGYSGLIGKRAFITIDYYYAKNSDFISDLVPQVGTFPGDTEGCVNVQTGQPQEDPTECPINADYQRWIGPDEAEQTVLVPTIGLTVAQALRNAVDNSVGGNTLGFRLAQDLDGDPVVVGRTYTNVGEVNTQGVDVGMQFFLARGISMQASYSWFDFEPIDDRQAYGDILLPNTPAHKGSLSFSYARGPLAFSISGRWVQGFRWAAGVFQGDVPEYTTADLNTSYRVNELIGVGLNVANFADEVHYEAFGGDLIHRRALVNLMFTF
jgi:outer membrane receptor protein involved in Fe transport